jgi:hypothetical protein
VVCNPPQTCNPATGNCETGMSGGTSCATDTDCPPSALGGTPEKCDPMFHFCYDPAGSCASNAECAPGQTCQLFCMGCVNTGFYCPPGLVCIPFPPGTCFNVGSGP